MPIPEPNAAAKHAIQLERIKIAASRNPVHLVIKTDLELAQVVDTLKRCNYVVSVEVSPLTKPKQANPTPAPTPEQAKRKQTKANEA